MKEEQITVFAELKQTEAMILVDLIEQADPERFSDWTTATGAPIDTDYLDKLCTHLQEVTYK